MTDSKAPDTASLRALAYQIWQSHGCPQGTAESDWQEAELRLAAAPPSARTEDAKIEGALQDSFPASDPPASHIPDRPPSNADEKWEAAGIKRSSVAPRKAKRSTPGDA